MSLRSFINRALGRSKPISIDLMPPPGSRATDDWQAGDLGECVDDGPWSFMGAYPMDGPKKGALVRVTAVSIVFGFDALALEGLPHWWQASAFRKLRPNQAEGSRKAWSDLTKKHRAKEPAHG
ncbi:MAG: hypothetical protein ACR652_17615 [Methylocystis sp.]|uniref:hypothetical protein n=1 Tax=Methylocystis sp. TaxID=1911079 RepID=UPI003DA2AFE2